MCMLRHKRPVWKKELKRINQQKKSNLKDHMCKFVQVIKFNDGNQVILKE